MESHSQSLSPLKQGSFRMWCQIGAKEYWEAVWVDVDALLWGVLGAVLLHSTRVLLLPISASVGW